MAFRIVPGKKEKEKKYSGGSKTIFLWGGGGQGVGEFWKIHIYVARDGDLRSSDLYLSPEQYIYIFMEYEGRKLLWPAEPFVKIWRTYLWRKESVGHERIRNDVGPVLHGDLRSWGTRYFLGKRSLTSIRYIRVEVEN